MAEEPQKVRNEGAVEGAQSVAEAVKRVADAVISDVQSKDIGFLPEVLVSGGTKKGNQFELRGEGFGTNGTLKVGGHQVKTTEWGPQHIVAELPADVKDGDAVTIIVDDKTTKTGYFGPQRVSRR
jgi:hypothetical protein